MQKWSFPPIKHNPNVTLGFSFGEVTQEKKKAKPQRLWIWLALLCSLTRTSGSPHQGHGLTFSLLQWLFPSVCGCLCLALGASKRSENWLVPLVHHAQSHYPSKSATPTASERQRWCEPHCTTISIDQGSETMCDGDFPSNQTLHQVISVSSSSAFISEITWSSPQMEWKPAQSSMLTWFKDALSNNLCHLITTPSCLWDW